MIFEAEIFTVPGVGLLFVKIEVMYGVFVIAVFH